MTKIKPFRALLYNQEKIKDISRVVCPPYDIIGEQKQQFYRSLSPYNLIHILLSKDTPGQDKYRNAANLFKEWLKDKILIQDESPSLYFYLQQYNLRGEKKIRLGFISLLQLTDKNQSVFSHERTRPEPKEDRFRLLKQVRANLSPIFAVFEDKRRIIQRTYQTYIQDKTPVIDTIDSEGVRHKLWRLESPTVIALIEEGLSHENIFIADGHHRYEVACAYREELKEKAGSQASGQENFNYILTYFTNADSRGLSIFPVHRLITLEAEFDFDSFCLRLKEYFDIEDKIQDKNRFFYLMERGGRTENVLGMYRGNKYWFLRLKNVKILDKIIVDKPKAYRTLGVSILNSIILQKILGLDIENKEKIKFSPDAEEFIKLADDDPKYIVFFLNPVKIQQVISVASNGERMPSKSTYFYPKVLSGLVINKLE